MAGFKSDLISKGMPSQQLRQFDVPDASDSENLDIDALNQRMQSRGLPPIDEATIRQMYAAQVASGGSGDDGGRKPPGPSEQFNNLAEMEHMAKEARSVRHTGKTKLNDAAKHRIEVLCEMSRLTREFTIDGNVYVLRNLKSKEMRKALVKASEFDGTVHSPFEIRRQLLAHSLFQIADLDIEVFLGDSSLEAKLEFLDELDEPVINQLYNEYLELSKLASDKYAVKTVKDAEEVTEELKK